MSGTKGHSGRRRRATAQRNGRVYVALDMAFIAGVNSHVITTDHFDDGDVAVSWMVDGLRFTDYAAAAAEFVRRVNEAQ